MSKENENKKNTGFWGRFFNSGEKEIETASNKTPVQEQPADNTGSIAVSKSEQVYQSEKDRLIAEEEQKRQEVAEAMEAAAAAELARARAELEYELGNAQTDAVTYEKESVKVQQEAAQLLSKLNAMEKEHARTALTAEQAIMAEKNARRKQEEEFSAIQQVNSAALQEAAANSDMLARELAEKQEVARKAAAELRKAEAMFAQSEKEWAKQQAEIEQAYVQAMSDAEACRKEAMQMEKEANGKLAVLNEQLAAQQGEYDAICAELDAAVTQQESKRSWLEESISRANSEIAQLNAKLEQAELEYTTQSEITAKRREALEKDIEELENSIQETAAAAAENQTAAVGEEAKAQQLEKEKAAVLAAAETEDEQLRNRMEVSRNEAAAKKEAYSAAQRRVEETTTLSVKANAPAVAAREKANRAAMERDDAATAADMAKKMKADAASARANTDEASSLLLSKAEMVLVNTTEKALRLLDEKTAAWKALDQEANRLQAEADLASREAQRAAETADQFIAQWMKAEEASIAVAVETDAARARLEEETNATVAEYDENIRQAKESAEQYQSEYFRNTQAHDDAVSLLESKKAEYLAAGNELTRLERDIHGFRDDIRVAVARQEEQKVADTDACRDALAELDDQVAQLKDKQMEKDTAIYEQQQSAAIERSRLEEALALKKNQVAALEQDTAEKGKLKEQTIRNIQQCTKEAEDLVAQHRNAAKDAADQVAQLEAGWQQAVVDRDSMQETFDRSLETVRGEAAVNLAPLEEAAAQAQNAVSESYLRLQELRKQAEEKVALAANVSISRLEAVNRVSSLKIGLEIVDIDEQIDSAEREVAKCTAAAAAAGQEFVDLTQAVDDMRKEELRISSDSRRQYEEVLADRTARQQIADKLLADAIAAEDADSRAVEDTRNKLAQAEQSFEEASVTLAQQKEGLAVSVEQISAKLAALNDEYEAAIAEKGDLPQLFDILQERKQILDTANKEFSVSQTAWQEQFSLVEAMRNRELETRQNVADDMEKLRNEHSDTIQRMKADIARLEQEKEELSAEYAKSQEYVTQAAVARKDVEEYLAGLQTEEDEFVSTWNKEAQDIREHLSLLQDDAEAKERELKVAEDILKNRDVMLAKAEKETQDSQTHYERIQADTAAADATYKTAVALANQASQSYQGVDKDTADILRKASEELRQAAENSAAALEDKKQQQAAAADALEVSKANLERLRKTVGDAPAQVESCKEALNKATDELRKYQDEADVTLAQLNKKKDDFLAQRSAAKADAEAAVAKCVQDSEGGILKSENLSRRLMEISTEISQQVADVQVAEDNYIAKEADMEAGAARILAEREQARSAAEELAARMEAEMNTLEHRRAEALHAFEEAETGYSNANDAYQLACTRLTEQYAADKKQVEDDLSARRDQVAQTQSLLEQYRMEKEQTAANLIRVSASLENSRTARVRAEESAEELRNETQRVLSSIDEEKLRILGNQAIARIAGEEKASAANQRLAAARTALETAQARLDKHREDKKNVEEKLARIKQEGAKTLELAKENLPFETKAAQ